MAAVAALATPACGDAPGAAPDAPAAPTSSGAGGSGAGAGGGEAPSPPAWSRRFGASGDDRARSIAALGDTVLLTGRFAATVDFGSGAVDSAGGSDLIVARYGIDGEPLGSLRLGGPGEDGGDAVAVDASGSVMVAGRFEGALDAGDGPLVSAGGADVLLARRTEDLAPMWTRRFGGPGTDLARAIAFDVACNIIVTGSFEETMELADGPLASAGGRDAFVIKVDQDGGYVWARRFGGAGDDEGLAVAVDLGGDVFVAGRSEGVCPGEAGPGAFVAKLDPAGEALWTRCFGGGANGAVEAIAVEGPGAGIVAGRFSGLLDLGATELLSAGNTDVDGFVAKLDGGGELVWAQRAGDAFAGGAAPARQRVTSVALDRDGRVQLAGTFGGGLDLAGLAVAAAPDRAPGAEAEDTFAATLDPDGAPLGGRAFAGADAESRPAIVAPFHGGPVATGDFAGAVDLGDGTHPAAGGADQFLLALPR